MPSTIPHGELARTGEYVHALVEGFYTRTVPQAYASVGLHDPAWGAAAEAFLKGVAPWLVAPRRSQLEGLAAQGKALVAKGCTDGLVLYGYGMVQLASGDTSGGEATLKRAVEALGRSKYHRFHAASAAALLAMALTLDDEADADATPYRTLSIRYAGEAASASGYARGEQRIFLDWLEAQCDTLFEERQEAVNAAVQGNPQADPYIAKVVGARYHVWAAWEARGGGWAKDVTEAQWVPFRAHMRKAKELLTAAYQLDPKLPEAPSDLICVVAAGPDPDRQHGLPWFRRAVAAQLDYQPAYDSQLWYLRPRWGGSLDQMYQFGLDCLNTGRFDTAVPMVFLTALSDIADDLDGAKTYWQKPETYQRLEALYAGYAKAKLLASQRDHLESIHAATDLLTGHPDQSKARIAELGTRFDRDAYEEYVESPEADDADRTGVEG